MWVSASDHVMWIKRDLLVTIQHPLFFVPSIKLATRCPPRLKWRERTPAAEGGTMGEKLPRILPKVATLHPVPRSIMGGSIPPLPIYDPMPCIEMTIFLLFVYLLKNYRIYCSILMRVHMFRLFWNVWYMNTILDFHKILICKEWSCDQNTGINVGNTVDPQM